MKHLYLLLLIFLSNYILAQTPIHSYNFNSSLNESGGLGPILVANGGSGAFVNDVVCGNTKRVYQFAAGQGLDYNVGATFTNTYSLEMVFKFSNVASYGRVLDYKNLTLDDGLYVVGGNLNFYPVTSGTGAPITANTYVHVVVTRNAAGTMNIYVNGCPHFTFNDASSRGITNAINKIVFFKDNGGENSAGSVSEIHVFNTELTAAQALARYGVYCPSVVIPPTPEIYEYLLDNNFAESSGKPTSLIPLGTGNFIQETFTNCGTKYVYNFDLNSGLQFNNTTAGNFFGTDYTIELYFKFQNLTSWRRIVEYKNRTSDTGPYAFNNQIQFYNVTTSGSFPFAINTYAHVVITRETTSGGCAASTKTVNMYVDGTLRATFNDAGNLGVLSVDNLLNFFRDDLAVPNEASAGTIALMRLYNYVLLPADVVILANDVPCPVLLNNPNTVLRVKRENKNAVLEWDNDRVPADATYLLERSVNGFDWQPISNVLPWSQINFEDFNPAAQTTYYRLRIDWDAQYLYSNTVAVAAYGDAHFAIYPNPIKSNQILNISATSWEQPENLTVELFNSLGQLVFSTNVQGLQFYQIELPTLAAGVYGLRLSSERVSFSKFQKIVVQ